MQENTPGPWSSELVFGVFGVSKSACSTGRCGRGATDDSACESFDVFTLALKPLWLGLFLDLIGKDFNELVWGNAPPSQLRALRARFVSSMRVYYSRYGGRPIECPLEDGTDVYTFFLGPYYFASLLLGLEPQMYVEGNRLCADKPLSGIRALAEGPVLERLAALLKKFRGREGPYLVRHYFAFQNFESLQEQGPIGHQAVSYITRQKLVLPWDKSTYYEVPEPEKYFHLGVLLNEFERGLPGRGTLLDT